MTEEFYERFMETATVNCRILPGNLLVAVSGGPDSVALLHLLLSARDALQINLIVAHVDHSLRPSSGDDLVFCQALADRLELQFISRQVETGAYAKRQKLSTETAARELRYQALQEMATAAHCRQIALGHTADDQAETVFGNMVRGAGLRGLGGMPFSHGNKVRPLLAIYRLEILDYLEENNIAFRTDDSNVDPQFRRNRIRHEVLPLVAEKLNPKVSIALNRMAVISQEAETYLNQQAGEALAAITLEKSGRKIVLDIQGFWRYFSFIRKYILRNALEIISDYAVRPDHAALARAEVLMASAEIGSRVPLHGGWELLVDHECLVIWDGQVNKLDASCEGGESIILDRDRIFTVSSRLPVFPNVKQKADQNNQFVDAEKVIGKIHVRNLRRGDKFRPLGLGGQKRVSDVLADQKVPLHKRSETIVVTCDAGIIWVVGYHLDERFKITEQTTSILHLAMKETNR